MVIFTENPVLNLELNIRLRIWFSTARPINAYSKDRIYNSHTRIINLKYVFIDFAAPNQMLKYRYFVWQIITFFSLKTKYHVRLMKQNCIND